MPLDLTIVIPVLNEEKNISGCLKAIGKEIAEKIVILDSGSTDNTKEIAHEYGAEIISFNWDGKFPKKRNWFLRNQPPKTKWVLFLDADEYITKDFKRELHEALYVDNRVGYWLNYTIYFMGKKLKGGYPLKKLALFRTGFGEYEEIKEEHWSKFDMEIHEHPILKGEIGNIKSKIDHQDFKGVSDYIHKHSEYAVREAKRFINVTRKDKLAQSWTWKQRLKYQLIGTVWIGPVYFFATFFLLGGFRDGSRGLAFAILKMSYFNQIYCRIREERKASNL